MHKPEVVVRITRSLKEEQWLDVFVDGWMIASIWGTAKVTFDHDPIVKKYWFNINDADIFVYADRIVRRKRQLSLPSLR